LKQNIAVISKFEGKREGYARMDPRVFKRE
jgi:hypothetical protein